MKSNQQVADEFTRNFSRFYETTSTQREEIYVSFQYRDCNQQGQVSGVRDNEQDNKPFTTVNIAAPLVRAVAGSEVMSASTLAYTSTDPNFDAEADIISDAVRWSQKESDFYAQRALAAEDAATCGIGAIVTYLDMTQEDFIAGVPMVERVSPSFLVYDQSPRGSQLNRKGMWCGYADPVNTDYMDEYIKANKEIKADIGAGEFKDYLMSYAYIENQEDIEFVYHYFWCEYTKIYDVANPFIGDGSPMTQAVMQDETVANILGQFAKEQAVNLTASYWTLDKEAFDALQETVETVQLLLQDMRIPDIEYSKRDGKAYYRAQFARGMMLKKSRSYTQRCHALNFITGYCEEATGNYYGMMRPLSYLQDYLNITMTDLLDYTRRATHGGSAWVSFSGGNGDAIERMAKARANEDDFTPVPEGTDITPKSLPATAQHLTSFINLMIELMPRALGLGQEFFGVISSGDMTDSLYGKVMRQSFAVLENWKNSSQNADIAQGYIFEDLTRLMASANDGLILPVLSPGHGQQAYFSLTKENLAARYSIEAVERPLTKDEKQDTFNKIAQLAPQAAQVGVNLFPMLARYAPMDKEDRDEMEKLATPQPPQPDPLEIATREATIDYTRASALKAEADAMRSKADAESKQAAIGMDMSELVAKIEEMQTKSDLNEAKTASEIAKIGESFDKRLLESRNNAPSSVTVIDSAASNGLVDVIGGAFNESITPLHQSNASMGNALDMLGRAIIEGNSMLAESIEQSNASLANAISEGNDQLYRAMIADKVPVKDDMGNVVRMKTEL